MNLRAAIGGLSALALCLVSASPANAETCENPDNQKFVQAKARCLAIRTFPVRDGSDTLVVILHGDLPRGGTADHIFPIGGQVAKRKVPAIVTMRPGYTGSGRTSTGRPSRKQGRYERYNEFEIDSIAAAVRELKSHYKAGRVVMIGYSGGALISGVMLGMHPDLVDDVVLVACPCDVERWRRARGRGPLPRAQSPQDWLEKDAVDARIIAMTGSRDRTAIPELGEDYVAAEKARGLLDARFVLVRGTGHSLGWRMQRAILAALVQVLAP